jgi:hypothetical protein
MSTITQILYTVTNYVHVLLLLAICFDLKVTIRLHYIHSNETAITVDVVDIGQHINTFCANLYLKTYV